MIPGWFFRGCEQMTTSMSSIPSPPRENTNVSVIGGARLLRHQMPNASIWRRLNCSNPPWGLKHNIGPRSAHVPKIVPNCRPSRTGDHLTRVRPSPPRRPRFYRQPPMPSPQAIHPRSCRLPLIHRRPCRENRRTAHFRRRRSCQVTTEGMDPRARI